MHAAHHVFTNGCFDCLHAGHIQSFTIARHLADPQKGAVVVGLNSDASVRRLKGHSRPINSFDERRKAIYETGLVDRVVEFDTEEELLALIVHERPLFMLKGDDYAGQLDKVTGYPQVLEWGGYLLLLPRLPGVSTTAILKARRGSIVAA